MFFAFSDNVLPVRGQNAGEQNAGGQNAGQICKGGQNADRFCGRVDKMPVCSSPDHLHYGMQKK